MLQDRVAATELAILFPAKMQSRSSRCTPIELGLSKTSILILDDQKGRLTHNIESPIIPCPTLQCQELLRNKRNLGQNIG